MVAKRKKKYSHGEGSQFLSRRAAMNKLQLTLKNFRKLCILKGVYPREPVNRKRAQKGDMSSIKTLYLKKDIQFLAQEPIIWNLREYKVFCTKVGRARATKDINTMRRLLKNHPKIKLDHIVKERYPTFIDAIRDLDDCLTLCFLFSTFPSMAHIPRGQSELCRRLTVEFMHAVIEAKALRKAFISIKGYYFQAEIKGQTITWIVPHVFGYAPQARVEVDFKVMSLFVEFYTVMLGFTNFRLYNSLNLFYPPKFSTYLNPEVDSSLVDAESFTSERVAALNMPLSRTGDAKEDAEVEEPGYDYFQLTDCPEKQEEIKVELEKVGKLKNLFKGLKFFISREVPREPIVFVIRSFGGEVSWESTLFVGATFAETDQTITHQIVDRPSLDNQYLSRYYVQPQWLFDSVNNCTLLPVQKYFIGAALPPHLSPFVNANRDILYVPPEGRVTDPTAGGEDEMEAEVDDEDEQDDDSEDEVEEKSKEDDNDDDLNEEEKARKVMKSKMAVSAGKVLPEKTPEEKTRAEKEAYKLREKMIKNKQRRLYKSMMLGRSERNREARLLGEKRTRIDKEAKFKKQRKALAAASE